MTSPAASFRIPFDDWKRMGLTGYFRTFLPSSEMVIFVSNSSNQKESYASPGSYEYHELVAAERHPICRWNKHLSLSLGLGNPS